MATISDLSYIGRGVNGELSFVLLADDKLPRLVHFWAT